MKKAITISVITIIGLLLAVLIFLSIRSSRIVYNNDNAIGNSAGNLNNGGLFCEYNDKIYFANPYDFGLADCAVANFYHPESTLMMSTAAFGGYELVYEAYKMAVKNGYMFGCYGDSLLILPD